MRFQHIVVTRSIVLTCESCRKSRQLYQPRRDSDRFVPAMRNKLGGSSLRLMNHTGRSCPEPDVAPAEGATSGLFSRFSPSFGNIFLAKTELVED